MCKERPAVIVTVHRPELTPEERERRMTEIKRAATRFYEATLRKKAAANARP